MDINATLIGQTIAMIVFVWFCMKFVWPPLLAMIEERQNEIAAGLAAADKGARALEEAESKIDGLLSEAREQARQIVDGANTRANSIMEEARGNADQERERILTQANAEVEQEVNRARDELRGQVGGLAIEGAEQILKREIDASAHKDLLDKLAAQI